MKTTMLPEHPDARSPAGADIRYLMDSDMGNMIHSTVPAHQINRATVHATVSEFWYVLEGHGETWRDNGVESCVTELGPGTALDIPVGTRSNTAISPTLSWNSSASRCRRGREMPRQHTSMASGRQRSSRAAWAGGR